MSSFDQEPRTTRTRSSLQTGRWTPIMWVVAAAIVVVLLIVIDRTSSRTSDIIENRASAPETSTGVDTVAPNTNPTPQAPAPALTPAPATPKP